MGRTLFHRENAPSLQVSSVQHTTAAARQHRALCSSLASEFATDATRSAANPAPKRHFRDHFDILTPYRSAHHVQGRHPGPCTGHWHSGRLRGIGRDGARLRLCEGGGRRNAERALEEGHVGVFRRRCRRCVGIHPPWHPHLLAALCCAALRLPPARAPRDNSLDMPGRSVREQRRTRQGVGRGVGRGSCHHGRQRGRRRCAHQAAHGQVLRGCGYGRSVVFLRHRVRVDALQVAWHRGQRVHHRALPSGRFPAWVGPSGRVCKWKLHFILLFVTNMHALVMLAVHDVLGVMPC